MSNLTPSEFLTSAEAMSPLKRKAHFSRLNSESLKRFRLDPAPRTEDSTITEYHQLVRLSLPEERDKLHVSIPFEEELEGIRDLKVIESILYLKITSDLSPGYGRNFKRGG